MKADFNKKQISQIITRVRLYLVLFVTTKGQMFKEEVDCEEAVRSTNFIIEDPSQHVGYIRITESMVTDEKVREFKDVQKFNDLFKEAKIPFLQKRKDNFERLREDKKNIPAGAEESIMNLLDDSVDSAAEKAAAEKAAAEKAAAEKVDETKPIDPKPSFGAKK